jgi:hypothetical protein
MAVNWPAAIHDGNGEGILVIDERANDEQRRVIELLISGRVGGPWKILRTTVATLHGPHYVPFSIDINGRESTVRAGEHITVDMEPVRNKVTGVASHARAILPEGFVFKEADLAATSRFTVSGPINFDHSGRYAALGPFAYAGP